ncbi:MAG: hypothetical protein AB8F34_16915 [Akkermansiaceae bacterium]
MELGFPGLKHRVKVVLPEGHDPAKKYPAILYYHGIGGEPDTSLIQYHTGGQQWIVVGMTYFQLGKFNMSRETMGKELTLLHSVKRHLQTKYGMDASRCYVAGFSKGGWLADMFLQSDSSLAGGVILGAGHLHKYHKTPVKYRKKKPVFIGVGRLDGNYPFALRAVLHHRKMGGRVTMEEWPDLGHAFPKEGSEALTQWLALRLVKPAGTDVIEQEMERLLADAIKLTGIKKWNELKRIRALPYAVVLGKDWLKQVDASIKAVEAQAEVKKEAKALEQHRKLLYTEITERSVEKLTEVSDGYAELLADYSDTQQAKLAELDRRRIARQIEFIKENKDAFQDEEKKPVTPKFPEGRRRIPINPLVK